MKKSIIVPIAVILLSSVSNAIVIANPATSIVVLNSLNKSYTDKKDVILKDKKALELLKPFKEQYNKLSAILELGKVELIAKPTEYGYIKFEIIPKEQNNTAAFVFYETKDKSRLIFGDIVLKNGKVLRGGIVKLPHHYTKQEIQTIKNGISFTYGEGKKDIYIVTDPECPFCRKFEKEFGDKLAKKYRIHVILYPLPFHKDAKAMSYYILAGKTDTEKAERFKKILSGSDVWKNVKYNPGVIKKEEIKLEKAQKAVEVLKAPGTPSMYDSNFQPIQNPNELLKGGK
ncbi:thioredoxin domain-containing protein [Caminibacter pacificus]|uniref:Thiol:disulfide interchange protein n=1 Tax=Caminibacter pacificus TaxID=1424653 RepID=A0AAJ4UX51_9BACT|nr:thioredoxin domain-containing protein [Caminibacter pacificus]QDD68172.1 thiol:disulfide interchange protein [Caminibacter pacificus]ROR38685.1 thiol:disulfide interchange protein DsbC [Caminibacter pacificus]